jgi:co-chaperonin GroES (HSP10)
MNKYTPFRNLILVKRLDEEKKTGTGIILPDNSHRNKLFTRLEVVSVGPDVKEALSGGDIILCENMVQDLDKDFALIQSIYLVVKEEQNGN